MAGRGNRKLANDALDRIQNASEIIKINLSRIQEIVKEDYPQVTALLVAGYESMKVFDDSLIAVLRDIF